MGFVSSLRLDDRFINFSQIPGIVANDLGAGISGVINGLGAMIILGTNRKINDAMNMNLCRFGTVLSGVYLSVLGVINPAAKNSGCLLGAQNFDYSKLNNRNLVIRDKVVSYLDGLRDYYQFSPSFLKREVLNRFSIALVFAGSVAARVADMAIGIIAASLSLVSFGASSRLNKFSYNQLQSAPGVISDIFAFTVLLINPNADFNAEYMH